MKHKILLAGITIAAFGLASCSGMLSEQPELEQLAKSEQCASVPIGTDHIVHLPPGLNLYETAGVLPNGYPYDVFGTIQGPKDVPNNKFDTHYWSCNQSKK